MSAYINTKDMIWPLHVGDLEILYGENVPDYIKPLIYQDRIGAVAGQTYEINQPIVIDGLWTITWKIREKTREEIEQEQIEWNKIG